MGVLDTTIDAFSVVPVSNGNSNNKHAGGLLPARQRPLFTSLPPTISLSLSLSPNEGVFEATDGAFTMVPTDGITSSAKFWDLAAVGTRIFFTPLNENGVGVLETCSPCESGWA